MSSPRELKRLIEKVNFNLIPEWNIDQINDAFKLIRDFKYLHCSNIEGNLRKIPWLFVENGCFVRASLASELIKENLKLETKKVFIFGKFKFKSNWAKEKIVTFRDHVAIAARVKSEVYIFDPAIKYDSAILLKDWVNILTMDSDDMNYKLCICNLLTFSHNSNCFEVNKENFVGIRNNISFTLDYFTMEYLAKEYLNIIDLGLDPHSIL